MDSKIVQVALNGLENILRLGEQEGKRSGSGVNPYCGLIEEAYGKFSPWSMSASREDVGAHQHILGNLSLFIFYFLLHLFIHSFVCVYMYECEHTW